MVWFKVDDDFHCHPKAIAAGNAAVGLWIRCCSWAAQQQSDGIVPKEVARMYGTVPQIEKLIKVGLWHQRGHDCPRCEPFDDDSYAIHEFLQRNPSRDATRNARESKANRQAKWRANRANQQVNDGADDLVDGLHERLGRRPGDSAPTRPDPTRLQTKDKTQDQPPSLRSGGPGGETSTSAKPARGTRLPKPYPVTADMVEWIRTNTPNVQPGDHESFCDYWHGLAGSKGLKVDWLATWRNWMRRANDNYARRPSNGNGVNGNRPSTTDQRVSSALELAEKYRQEEIAEEQRKAIGP